MTADLREQLQSTLGSTYTLERELGGGGMSRVFVADETALGRKVVVKVLAPELAAGVSAERFTREIRFAAQLQHPNIVPLHAAGVAGGLPYYTMPFVEGLSLRSRLRSGESIPVAECIRVLRGVARALGYAHEHGVVHRDIKPENVLLSGDTAVVTDFGIAKAVRAARTLPGAETLTQVGTGLGTPAYMAPEQASGDPATDHRADLYSFGCLGYELLTGKPPFAEQAVHRLLIAHAVEAPPAIGSKRLDAPRPLADLVMQCLAKNPDARPQSAREILERLDSVGTPSSQELRPVHATTRTRMLIGISVVAVVVLLAAGFALATRVRDRARSEGGEVRSLAVLPFENVGGDTANTYFADGMADELTVALAKVPALRVAARSSAYAFKGKRADVREVARALDVGAVLEGTVRRAGDRLRVSAQLTSAKDGLVMWTESYERDGSDVFAIQDDIAKAIASALRVKFDTGLTSGTGATQGTENLEAYDLFLRGQYFQRGLGARKSVEYYEQAIEKDPAFARAHAGLSAALGLVPFFLDAPTQPAVARATQAAERAVALDSLLPDAHTALARAYTLAFRWEEGNTAFRRAIALDPNYALAHSWYGGNLMVMGRGAEAAEEMRVAARLDPLSGVTAMLLSRSLLLTGHEEESLRAARRALELDSTLNQGWRAVAFSALRTGRREEARMATTHAVSNLTPSSWGAVIYIVAALGDTAQARSLIRRLESDPSVAAAFREGAIAVGYLGLGDTTKALEALERAARSRDLTPLGAPFLDPMFDSVRRSERFRAVLRSYNLDERLFSTIDSVGRR